MILFRDFFSRRFLAKIGLLVIAMSALASGVNESLTEVRTGALFPVAVFALLLAWTLAFSKTSSRRSWMIIIVSGFIFIFLQTAQLWSPMAAIIRDIFRLEISLIRWAIEKSASPDLSALNASFAQFLSLSAAMIERIHFVIQAKSIADPVTREFAWDVPILFLAAWAGWALKRHKNALYALAPTIALLAYVLYYSGHRPFSLQVSVAMFLLLTGMNEWEKNLNNQSETGALKNATADFNMTLVTISLAIALASGWIPSVSVKKLTDSFTQHQHETRNRQFAKALGLVNDPQSTRKYVTPGLPRQHLIGASPSTSQTVVFTVKTGELPPMPNNEIDEEVPRYYWRGVTYDVYTGQGWATTLAQSADYPANRPLFDVSPEGYRLIHLDFRKASSSDERLYWTGTLVSVDKPFRLGWRSLPGAALPSQDPFSGADPTGAVLTNARYEATALLPVTSIEELRATPQQYPQAILNHYMSLPAAVTERVRNLAAEITADNTNPYDKAAAIESYLRTFPYTLKVPAPPQDKELADYFLFDLRTGYCDYYATSMVVMARAVGLPARLVTGFSSGSYIPSSAEYVVREANAHSWVEIYFTGVGWVEFEPTAGLPAIIRPLKLQTSSTPIFPAQTSGTAHEYSASIRFLIRYLPMAGFLVLAVIFSGAGFYLIQLRALSKANIQQIYRQVFQQGDKLTPALKIHETPLMFAERLRERLRRLPKAGFSGRILSPASQELEFLTSLYVRAVYSARPASNEEGKQARVAWHNLYWRLLLARAIKTKDH